MAQSAELSLEEAIGMGIAATLHVGLAATLLLQRGPPVPIPEPQRIVVSLAEEVALESTSPNPAPAAASVAPVVSDVPEPEPAPEPVVVPPPRPTATPTRRPTPTPTASRRPTPTPTASRRPTPTPTASRRPTPTPTASRRPTPTPSATASRRPTPTPTSTRGSGGSELGDNFLAGAGGTATPNSGTPAATFGAAERASLSSAISREIDPHWAAPQGVDVELLVTVVRFRLNIDGRLVGTPTCIRQSGENSSNRTQMAPHCERAIRAVTLAAPFNLPRQFYTHWDQLEWTFDRRS